MSDEMTDEQKLDDLYGRIQVMRQELLILESGTPECEAKRRILAASTNAYCAMKNRIAHSKAMMEGWQ